MQELPLRFLVVESTQLAKAKAPRLTAAQQAEQGMLTALQQQWQRRTFTCEADARQAATLCLRALALHYHQLTYTLDAEWVPAKRATRGRPPKDAPCPQRQVWRVSWQVQEATAAIMAQAQRERRFVLATNVLETQHLSDADLLRAYKGQPAVALSCVYLMALLVYTLVERQVRKRLTERRETLPDRPAPSQRPTARTVFQLMRNLAVVTLQRARHSHRHVTTLNAHQLHVLRLLGYAPSIYGLPHRNSG